MSDKKKNVTHTHTEHEYIICYHLKMFVQQTTNTQTTQHIQQQQKNMLYTDDYHQVNSFFSSSNSIFTQINFFLLQNGTRCVT